LRIEGRKKDGPVVGRKKEFLGRILTFDRKEKKGKRAARKNWEKKNPAWLAASASMPAK